VYEQKQFPLLSGRPAVGANRTPLKILLSALRQITLEKPVNNLSQEALVIGPCRHPSFAAGEALGFSFILLQILLSVCSFKERTDLLSVLEQLSSYSLVQCVFQKFVYLFFDILVPAFFKQLERAIIDDSPEFQAAINAELDVLSVAKNEPLIADMLFECNVQKLGELVNRKIHRHEARQVHAVYVSREDYLPILSELKYLDE
jgi:hypothetical protein